MTHWSHVHTNCKIFTASGDQASFTTANLLEIQSQEKTRDRRTNVTSPAPPEVILKREQELSFHGRMKNSNQSYFEEL